MKKFIILLTATILLASPATSYAAMDEATEDEFIQNNIMFYNPGEAGCTLSDVGIVGADNAEKIWNYFTGHGLTPVAVAGIMGNFQAESGLRPTVKQDFITTALSPDDGSVGFGLAQWTPASRKGPLFAKMDEAGLSKYYGAGFGSRDDQIPDADNDKLLKVELDYAWNGETGWSIENIVQQLNAATTIDGENGSTVLFHQVYERSADSAAKIQNRVNLGMGIFERLAGVDNSGGCSGALMSGGMNLEQARDFMKQYKSGDMQAHYSGVPQGSRGDAAHFGVYNAGCSGGALANCVAFSEYFINRYTAKPTAGAGGGYGLPNGREVVSTLLNNGFADGGHIPKVYAVFSANTSSASCPGCGHTGVVLGINTDSNKIVIGEASCGDSLDWINAYEYDLAKFSSDIYTYAYTDGVMKGGVD
jgi:hypothetical protein